MVASKSKNNQASGHSHSRLPVLRYSGEQVICASKCQQVGVRVRVYSISFKRSEGGEVRRCPDFATEDQNRLGPTLSPS